MKKGLIIALCLVLAGLVLIAAISLIFRANPLEVLSSTNLNFGSCGTIGLSNEYRDWDNEYLESGKYEVAAYGITALDIEWIDGSVEVISYDGSVIAFEETPLSQEQALRYGIDSGTLYIQYCQKDISLSRGLHKKLTVMVPNELDRLNIEASSATIAVENVNARLVELESSSGEIDYLGGYAELDASSSSGEITVSSTSDANRTSIESSSGAIAVSGDMGALSMESASGKLGMANGDGVGCNSLIASSTSGSIRLSLTSTPTSMELETTSGEIEIELPSDSEFVLEYDTTSGSFDCGFAAVYERNRIEVGSGKNSYKTESTSGNISIRPIG
ncbi:MAG: DUF4097 family beta strand repeat-containing protein [Clostridia bacterium]|nr:DUF4097 family beta strand repeat-containing protein [Clostridia bacterium]